MVSKRSPWISRTLIESPYHVGLCRTEEQFMAELSIMDVPREHWPKWMPEGYSGKVHRFEKNSNTRNELAMIVCIDNWESVTVESIYGLLIHESIHVWQYIREAMNEQNPSREFEAYSIQMIAQNLIEAWGEFK